VLHLDHVGCMASPEEESDLGAATEAAGFPQQRTFPSTVFARQLAELAGHQVPTTIFEARGGAAQGPIGVEFAIPSRIEQDVIEGWIRAGIGAHVAFSVTDPSVFEQLRNPMRSAGYQVSEFMNGRPASNPAAGVTLLYFDRRPAEPLGIEFCYSARSTIHHEAQTAKLLGGPTSELRIDLDSRIGSYQPPSARRSYLSSESPSSKTSSFRSVKDSRNHSESSRPTPLFPAPPKGASWSQ
jgi:hypothetical protein